MKLKPKYYKAQ